MDNRKLNPELKDKYKLDENTVQFGEDVPEPKTRIKEPEEPIIRKDKAYYGIDESFEGLEETEEDEIEDVAGIKQNNVNSEQEYLLKAIENSDEEQKLYLKYVSLGLKQQDGKVLTDEEKTFMIEMNKMYVQEAEQQAQLEKQEAEQTKIKEEVLKEYQIVKTNDPTKIDIVKVAESNVNGNTSIPKLLKFAFTLKKAKKHGGKILVKVTRDRNVFIEWTNKPLSYVEFWTKDEKGTEIPEVTRFNEFKYNYEGTPIPVLFAIQGYAEGFDWFGEFKKDISSEYVARLVSKARHAGFLEGLNQSDKQKKGGFLGTLTEYMPLILIVGLLIIGFMMYTLYGEMATLYKAVTALQEQIAITGALVVR